MPDARLEPGRYASSPRVVCTAGTLLRGWLPNNSSDTWVVGSTAVRRTRSHCLSSQKSISLFTCRFIGTLKLFFDTNSTTPPMFLDLHLGNIEGSLELARHRIKRTLVWNILLCIPSWCPAKGPCPANFATQVYCGKTWWWSLFSWRYCEALLFFRTKGQKERKSWPFSLVLSPDNRLVLDCSVSGHLQPVLRHFSCPDRGFSLCTFFAIMFWFAGARHTDVYR